MKRELKTNLSRVKSLGSAKKGLEHWLALRWSSLLLIPFTFWFIVKITRLCSFETKIPVNLFKSPIDMICFIIFGVFSVYHGALGMHVIIEDYIHNKIAKRAIIILINFFSLVSCSAFILSLLKYYTV